MESQIQIFPCICVVILTDQTCFWQP